MVNGHWSTGHNLCLDDLHDVARMEAIVVHIVKNSSYMDPVHTKNSMDQAQARDRLRSTHLYTISEIDTLYQK